MQRGIRRVYPQDRDLFAAYRFSEETVEHRVLRNKPEGSIPVDEITRGLLLRIKKGQEEEAVEWRVVVIVDSNLFVENLKICYTLYMRGKCDSMPARDVASQKHVLVAAFTVLKI